MKALELELDPLNKLFINIVNDQCWIEAMSRRSTAETWITDNDQFVSLPLTKLTQFIEQLQRIEKLLILK